jgi:hypothetical protein
MAQRMTMLYGFNSPEFFDPSLFENFIDLLRARGVVRTDNDSGRLLFDEVLIRVAARRARWCCRSRFATAFCRSPTASAGTGPRLVSAAAAERDVGSRRIWQLSKMRHRSRRYSR